VKALRLLAVALCTAGALAAVVAYRSERRTDEVVRLTLASVSGKNSARPSDSPQEKSRRKALDLVSSARLLNPDTNIDVQVGAFLEPDPRRGEAILRRATDKEPENVFLWLALSKRQERDGRLAPARRSYARARALDSRLPAPR
jgi:hypothetical protein